jgi:hypothetical protein
VTWLDALSDQTWVGEELPRETLVHHDNPRCRIIVGGVILNSERAAFGEGCAGDGRSSMPPSTARNAPVEN